jgi:hypothetical protein
MPSISAQFSLLTLHLEVAWVYTYLSRLDAIHLAGELYAAPAVNDIVSIMENTGGSLLSLVKG